MSNTGEILGLKRLEPHELRAYLKMLIDKLQHRNGPPDDPNRYIRRINIILHILQNIYKAY